MIVKSIPSRSGRERGEKKGEKMLGCCWETHSSAGDIMSVRNIDYVFSRLSRGVWLSLWREERADFLFYRRCLLIPQPAPRSNCSCILVWPLMSTFLKLRVTPWACERLWRETQRVTGELMVTGSSLVERKLEFFFKTPVFQWLRMRSCKIIETKIGE